LGGADKDNQAMTDDETRPEAHRRVTAEAALRDASPAHAKAPRKLQLEHVNVEALVFQQRGKDRTIFSSSQRHIDNLADFLKANPKAELDPLTVWWSGARWIVIDGHHRLKAYRQVKSDVTARRVVKALQVEAFNGTLNAAILRSAEGNTKDKLPMTFEEKADCAWRMVCLPSADRRSEVFTKSQIAKSGGVSERTVASMRKVRREMAAKIDAGEFQGVTDDFLHSTPAPELGTLSWGRVQAMNAGDTENGGAGGEWLDAEVQRWAERLARAFGKKPVDQPGLMARALLALSPVMVKTMLSDPAWYDIRNEVEEEERLHDGQDVGFTLPGELEDF
jgi:hypothetical protein